MANLSLFASSRRALPAATARNEAGGLAYARSPRGALALYAATGCLNSTFYANDAEQLDRVLALCAEVEPRFVAQTAIYARRIGAMKDTPALLLASLSVRDRALFAAAFPQVVDNGRLLRNVVQILRSGRVGRKSLGSLPKRLVREWLDRASEKQLLSAAIGNAPSLADVMVRVTAPMHFAGRFVSRDLGAPAAYVPRTYRAPTGGLRLDGNVPFEITLASDPSMARARLPSPRSTRARSRHTDEDVVSAWPRTGRLAFVAWRSSLWVRCVGFVVLGSSPSVRCLELVASSWLPCARCAQRAVHSNASRRPRFPPALPAPP